MNGFGWSIVLSACLQVICIHANAGELTAKPIVKDTPTAEELTLKLKKGQINSTGATYTSPPGNSATASSASSDLMANSEVLCFAGAITFVPKHAVLITPRNLAIRLQASPSAKLVSWGEFLPANRSWVATVEVSPEQASGKLPISLETSDSMTKTGKLVVATYNGNPISVLPAAVPATPIPNKPISQP